jgi:hypothetical protein
VQRSVDVKGGSATWSKSDAFGGEVAMYIRRATN